MLGERMCRMQMLYYTKTGKRGQGKAHGNAPAGATHAGEKTGIGTNANYPNDQEIFLEKMCYAV